MRVPPSGDVYFEHLMFTGALLRAYTVPMLLFTIEEVYKSMTPLPRGYSWGAMPGRRPGRMMQRILLAETHTRVARP